MKKFTKLPKKTWKSSTALLYIFRILHPNMQTCADISQLSKPKHRLRYKWGQVLFTKYVFKNMWIWFTFLKRVWSCIFVLKFTFLPLFVRNYMEVTQGILRQVKRQKSGNWQISNFHPYTNFSILYLKIDLSVWLIQKCFWSAWHFFMADL